MKNNIILPVMILLLSVVLSERVQCQKVQSTPTVGRGLINSLGEITDISLQDQGLCSSLPYFNIWADSLKGKKIFILLVNPDLDDNGKAQLALLKNKVNVTVVSLNDPYYAHHIPMNDTIVSMNKTKAIQRPMMVVNRFFPFIPPHANNAGNLGDVLNNGYNTSGDGTIKKIIYVDARYYSTQLLALLKSQYGNDIMVVTGSSPFLQGGNYLKIGAHLFVGKTFIEDNNLPNAAYADSVIRAEYLLPGKDRLSIDFIGEKDQAIGPILYHLDLMLTCTGIDAQGVTNFFIPYIPQSQLPSNQFARNVSTALEKFTIEADSVFLLRYKNKSLYRITRVPAFVHPYGDYICSPVNGVVDEKDNVTKYYFPWVYAPDDIHVQSDTLYKYEQIALDIFRTRLGNDNVIMLPVPGDLVWSNSQSLHCTMAVTGRKKEENH